MDDDVNAGRAILFHSIKLFNLMNGFTFPSPRLPTVCPISRRKIWIMFPFDGNRSKQTDRDNGFCSIQEFGNA
jgi:hypothetical protein